MRAKEIEVAHDWTGAPGEAVVPFPGPRATISPATKFRSTWVVSSLEGLRNHGHYERFLNVLTEHREEILSSIAGTWLPMPVAYAHYKACDALGLSDAEHAAMIRGPGARVRRAWYARLIAAADQAKVDPWTVLGQLNRSWQRGVNGGAAAVFRLKPTVARVEYVRCELFGIPYYMRACRFVLLALIERFDARAVVRILPNRSDDEGHFLLDWT
jgi:hypothetical protein